VQCEWPDLTTSSLVPFAFVLHICLPFDNVLAVLAVLDYDYGGDTCGPLCWCAQRYDPTTVMEYQHGLALMKWWTERYHLDNARTQFLMAIVPSWTETT
jgi:hypothetical protein